MNMQFNNKIYGPLKFLAMIGLPALATFIIAIDPLWGIPNEEAIVGTIIAADTFLGALLGISTKQYNDNPKNFAGYLGSTSVDPDTGIPDMNMTITKPPEEILSGKEVRLKIGQAPPQAS